MLVSGLLFVVVSAVSFFPPHIHPTQVCKNNFSSTLGNSSLAEKEKKKAGDEHSRNGLWYSTPAE